jgi:hypothetical protein
MSGFDVRGHGRRFAPEYPPRGNSDHLPMTWLALGALGAGRARQQRFADSYLKRLEPFREADAHCRRIEAFGEAMARRGVETVLEERLPALMSGWYREAYHPVIRLAYGVAFEVLEEAAAGLAYLESAGPCPRLAALADQARPGDRRTREGVLRSLTGAAGPGDAGSPFGARAARALAHPDLARAAVTLDDNLARSSREALDAFAATHDFFALHLVTGSHAFRILSHLVGPRADALLNLGLGVGYLAIGAPPFSGGPVATGTIDQAGLLALCGDDEHDIKLAWTAWDQARHNADTAYLSVARDYLEGSTRSGTRAATGTARASRTSVARSVTSTTRDVPAPRRGSVRR